jgi:hypothetical protein
MTVASVSGLASGASSVNWLHAQETSEESREVRAPADELVHVHCIPCSPMCGRSRYIAIVCHATGAMHMWMPHARTEARSGAQLQFALWGRLKFLTCADVDAYHVHACMLGDVLRAARATAHVSSPCGGDQLTPHWTAAHRPCKILYRSQSLTTLLISTF